MKKIFKKICLSLWALSMIVHIFAPLTVLADNVDIVLTFTVEANNDITIKAEGTTGLSGKLSTSNKDSIFGFKKHGTDDDLTAKAANCDDNTHCTITVEVPAGDGIDLKVGGDAGFEFGGNISNITQSGNLTVRVKGNNQQQEEEEEISNVPYKVTIALTDNMKKYYELTSDTYESKAAIKATLKNNPSVVSYIQMVKDQDKSVLDVTTTCNSTKDSCEMTAPADTKVNLNFDKKVVSFVEEHEDEEGRKFLDGYNDKRGISNVRFLLIDEPRDFDGKAVLLWDCNGKICYNYSNFDDLSSQVAKTTYMDETTIANQNTNAGDNTIKFSVHSREKFFAPYWKFQVLKAEIDAGTKKIDAYKGERGIDYPPLEEPIENNTYISYMNRGPKMIIYNKDYRGIKLADLESLKYYPSEWANAFKRRESYDISGTTKENPTEILALLLQDSVTINALSSYNGFTIKSIEALDVPEGAVEVAKVDNKFNLIFHSNYFEKVVFKALDNEDHEYYFLVNRRTMDPGFNRIGHGEDAILEAEIFYDNQKKYEDYNVLGKIQYKNGTTKVIELTITNYGDDGFGNPIDVLEWDEDHPPIGDAIGKGIKRAKFTYTISDAELKTVDKIYINVEKAGSTGTTYAGNFAGSGKGNVIDMANWKLQLYGEDRV